MELVRTAMAEIKYPISKDNKPHIEKNKSKINDIEIVTSTI
jgi:hypothetical protein